MLGSMRILVVEDEKLIAEAIAEWLRADAFAVDVALDGQQALDRLDLNEYDVVVLDRDLPRVHGDQVCREILQRGGGPRILMLTAAGAVRDRVNGLALGADDYLAKPFAFAELSARVHALTRRPSTVIHPVLVRHGIEVDPARHAAHRDGRDLHLAPREFALLAELLRAGGTVVSAEQLLEKVWNEDIDAFTNAVRVTMMKLRKKLGDPQPIETLPGVGYRIP